MFETFDHTADIGLRIRAATEEEMFCDAGRGLFSLLVDNIEQVQSCQTTTFNIIGNDRAYRLFDWLNELLYCFETEKWLFADFSVRLSPDGLTATATGERFNADRHRLRHEVKAVTYHHLVCEQTDNGWLAEVIFDI